jgi:hypothetical protein
MPILLSLAVFEGWTSPLVVVGLFAALELLVNNVLEPLLYSNNMGISSVGVILAAIFWTWLWGPVGLILSIPLTVCLLVAGNYIGPLKFLVTLLGDRTELSLSERVYQRLLAKDDEEAAELAEEYTSTHSLNELFDDLLLGVLRLAEQDRDDELLPVDQSEFVLDAVGQLVEDMEDETRDSMELETVQRGGRVLLMPVRQQSDGVLAVMLARLLESHAYDIHSGSADLLTREHVDLVENVQPDVVVLSALAPYSNLHARHLVKRLRRSYPELRILVGLWGTQSSRTGARLLADGATCVVGSLSEAVKQIQVALQTAPARRPKASKNDEGDRSRAAVAR